MSRAQYHCQQEQRRAAVRAAVGEPSSAYPKGKPRLNGLDYLEVAGDGRTLFVYFIHPQPQQSLTLDNIQLSGGSRRSQIRLESITLFDRQMTLRVNQKGDFSTYTLRLIRSSADDVNPPVGIDPQLAQIAFSFWAGEESEYDCQPLSAPVDPPPPPPVIDYLAKDYASFRQLMLDRLSVTLPNWQERNPTDLGVMLVELLAYKGDQLSYFQDAVATEAYLGTARKRVSVRRHARLLDYAMHDGCNARAWLVFLVSGPVTLPGPEDCLGEDALGDRAGTMLFTQVLTLPKVLRSQEDQLTAFTQGAQVFETMHPAQLHPQLNELHFYTWGNRSCTLPTGATQATLIDTGGHLRPLLKPGQVIIFEERLSPTTGLAADADLHHRHPVRLISVTPTEDPLFVETSPETDVVETAAETDEPPLQRVVTIRWALADALPFELTVSSEVQGRPIEHVSVAWGNVVLADHGRTIIAEKLPLLPTDLAQPLAQPYRPRLRFGPLSQQGYVFNAVEQRWQRFDPQGAAIAAAEWALRDARPSITLQTVPDTQAAAMNAGSRRQEQVFWRPQRDLLKSGPFALDFVPETAEDGQVTVRFGDSVLGRRPDEPLQAQYRIGNGRAGNVGAKSISHIYLPDGLPDGSLPAGSAAAITDIFNPLPATGGVDPESIETVKLFAPEAFRAPQRAVTTEDYAHFAEQFPGVQRALATRRWTGSWHTLFVTVDRAGGEPVDEEFEAELLDALEPVRLAGHDLKIESPRFVPLDIALRVQVEPEYFVEDVRAALIEAFGHRVGRSGKRGFFHPDNFTFGQPVYLSPVVAAAVQVTGVRSAVTTRFQRWGKAARQELSTGQISLDRLEIAQLNNDASLPEQGRLIFEMEGGL